MVIGSIDLDWTCLLCQDKIVRYVSVFRVSGYKNSESIATKSEEAEGRVEAPECETG